MSSSQLVPDIGPEFKVSARRKGRGATGPHPTLPGLQNAFISTLSSRQLAGELLPHSTDNVPKAQHKQNHTPRASQQVKSSPPSPSCLSPALSPSLGQFDPSCQGVFGSIMTLLTELWARGQTYEPEGKGGRGGSSEGERNLPPQTLPLWHRTRSWTCVSSKHTAPPPPAGEQDTSFPLGTCPPSPVPLQERNLWPWGQKASTEVGLHGKPD